MTTLPSEAVLEVTQGDEIAAVDALRAQPYAVGQHANWTLMAEHFARHRLASSSNSSLVELLREARDGLIGNTAIITAGQNHDAAQAAGARLTNLLDRIDAALPEQDRSTSEGEGA